MNAYIPILVIGAIATLFAVGSVGIALLIGPRRYNRAKLEAYECGIEPIERGSVNGLATGQRFPVKYYLTAMLFIVFDIELAFLYPVAVTLRDDGALGLVVLILFVFTVVEALVYIWKKGALEWR